MVGAVIVVSFVGLVIASIVSDGKREQPENKQTTIAQVETQTSTQQTTKTTQPPTTLTIQSNSDLESDDTTIEQTTHQYTIPPSIRCQLLAAQFSDFFGENVDVLYQEEVENYVIMLWKDGLADETESIQTDSKYLSDWNNMVNAFAITSINLSKETQNTQPNAHVTLMLLNDKNHSSTLLTITDGLVLYNVSEDK